MATPHIDVDLFPAGRAAQQVGGQDAALSGFEDVEGEFGGFVAHLGAGQLGHGWAPSGSRASRSFIMAERIRVLAVPNGTPSAAATSWAVIPYTPAITTARACSAGRPPRAARNSSADSVPSERRSGSSTLRPEQPDQVGGIDGRGLASPDRVDGQIVGDGGQPGAHRAPAGVEAARPPPGPLEGLLGHVLGQMRIAHHGQGHAEHVALEPAHERQSDLRAARGQPLEQSVISHSLCRDADPGHAE